MELNPLRTVSAITAQPGAVPAGGGASTGQPQLGNGGGGGGDSDGHVLDALAGLYTEQLPEDGVEDFHGGCCFAESHYRVYALGRDKAGRGGPVPRLFVRERSHHAGRACCAPCRATDVVVEEEATRARGAAGGHFVDAAGAGGGGAHAAVVMRARKTWGLPGAPFACCRAHMELADADGAPTGAVFDRHRCCAIKLSVHDAEQRALYFLEGQSLGCCGCHCPWHSYSAAIRAPRLREPTGSFTKLPAKMCGGTNTYALDFPAGVTRREKELLLGAQLLFEHAYFERGSSDRCARR